MKALVPARICAKQAGHFHAGLRQCENTWGRSYKSFFVPVSCEQCAEAPGGFGPVLSRNRQLE